MENTKQTINGVEIKDIEAAENYAIEKMGKDANRRFVDIAYMQWFNKLKAEYSIAQPMESKHTLHYDQGSIKADNGQTVAYMNREAGTTPLSPVERDDMSKIFAAAPELLAFAIEMIKRYPNSPWISEQATAAINKATL